MAVCPKCGGEITYLIVKEVTTHTEEFGKEPMRSETVVETTWRCPLCDGVIFEGSAEIVQSQAEKFLGLR